MAEGINVRLPAQLKAFVEEKASPDGLYGSASEYIRDLVRHDYEQTNAQSWESLNSHLKGVMKQPRETYSKVTLAEVVERNQRIKAG